MGIKVQMIECGLIKKLAELCNNEVYFFKLYSDLYTSRTTSADVMLMLKVVSLEGREAPKSDTRVHCTRYEVVGYELLRVNMACSSTQYCLRVVILHQYCMFSILLRVHCYEYLLHIDFFFTAEIIGRSDT